MRDPSAFLAAHRSHFVAPMKSSVAIAVLLVSVSCAAPGAEDEEVMESTSELSGTERARRYAAIRQAATARGFPNGYLLAGIAYTESGLAHCWSEATWACKGPSSPECGGGPLIAGRFDSSCVQGGLGLLQFDAGTFSQTLARYGNGIFTVDGQVALGIDYVVEMVRRSAYTTNAETTQKARVWVDTFDPNDGVRRDQWIKTVLRHYNGCQPGWSCWTPRYQTYAEGLATVLAESGGPAFWRGTSCIGARGTVVGAIEVRYRALGGCGSALGRPTSDELRTPDGVGRYSVFERGSIYWTSQTGAHDVLGRIRDEWAARGWEGGALGYPTSGEYDVAGGKRSDFQRGSITWNAATNDVAVEVAR